MSDIKALIDLFICISIVVTTNCHSTRLNNKHLDISCTSSTESVLVKSSSKDDDRLLWSSYSNEGNLTLEDGLLLLVLHEKSMEILTSKVFATWNAFAYDSEVVWWIKRIQTGRLIVLAVQKSGTYGLKAAHDILESLGSVMIRLLPYEALWIWIFVKGGKTLIETARPNGKNVPLSLASDIKFWYSSHKVENTEISQYGKRIWHFCQENEGLGEFCSLETIYKMDRAVKENLNSNITASPMAKLMKVETKLHLVENRIGITVLAGTRFQYLLESLLSLFSCPEIHKGNVFVIIGVSHQTNLPNKQTTQLLKLINIPYRILYDETKIISNSNFKNFQFYKKAWKFSTQLFRSAKYLAFLDEDVKVAKDWMALMLHGTRALDIDKTLWCVSGTPFYPKAGPEFQLLRGRQQVGWGFVVSRHDAIMSVNKWPDIPNTTSLFDLWLLENVSKQRECIYPALGRSKHFGLGINSVSIIHKLYFLDASFFEGSFNHFTPIHLLTLPTYAENAYNSIKKSKVINLHNCQLGLIGELSKKQEDCVIYFRMDHETDLSVWTLLAECLRAWPYSNHGMHRETLRIPFSNNHSLWLVGSPASFYSKIKPKDVEPWNPQSDDFFQNHQKVLISVWDLPLRAQNLLCSLFEDL